MSDVLWRCRECGKWSSAKRDPIRHKRWHKVEGRESWRGWFVWCGPFDRWTVQLKDPSPRDALPSLGEAVNLHEKRVAESADDGVPF